MKVVVKAADEDTALAVDVVPGQASDAPLLVPMLARTLDRVTTVTRTSSSCTNSTWPRTSSALRPRSR